MKSHPYLRAYMAGITVPTVFLLVVLGVLIAVRRFCQMPMPIERFAIFPMAVVPNAWGVWNVLRLAGAEGGRIPLGGWGALLAVVLPFLGYGLSRALGFQPPALPASAVAIAWLVAILLYYLAWKILVAFLNELLGVDG